MATKDINKYFKAFYKEYNRYAEGVHGLKEGASDRTVYDFEEKYNMNLPYYYKEWLKVHNGGVLFTETIGTKIYGILGKDKIQDNEYYIEDNFSGAKRPKGLPATLFMIAQTTYGDIIGFDLENTTLEDGRIVYWNKETQQIEEEWPSFAKWLKDEMLIGKEEVDYNGDEKI